MTDQGWDSMSPEEQDAAVKSFRRRRRKTAVRNLVTPAPKKPKRRRRYRVFVFWRP